MSDVTIDIVSDGAAAPDRGAVIRLNGLWLLPQGTTFTIEPADGLLDVSSPGVWPHGDLKPAEMLITPQGVDLVLPLDLFDYPMLRPGTSVVVAVPQAAARGLATWPAPPSAVDDVAEAGSAVAREAPAVELNPEQQASEERQRIEREVQESLDKLAASLNSIAAVAPPPEPTQPAQDVPLQVAIASVRESAAREAASRPAPFELASLKSTMDRERPAAAAAPAPFNLPIQVATRPAGELTVIAPPERKSPPASSFVVFAAGFAVASVLTAAAWYLSPPSKPPAALTAAATATPVAKPIALDDLMTPGDVSPRGKDATGVSQAEAMALADKHLHADQPDRAEAEFWLRRAVSGALGSGNTRWALTQLGTLLVDPSSKQPDYARARLLWEMAASQGDTVAMCFLGSLHEAGLGVVANPAAALSYYKRAKGLGGCRGVDAAIARLTK